MSGKGDTRRPAAVPGEAVRDNWDRTFKQPPPDSPPDATKDASEEESGQKVRP